MTRVAVTGLGVLTANASTIAEFRDTLVQGRVAIAPCPIGGLVARDMPLATGLRFEQVVNRLLMFSEDAAEGPKAFAEKRQPQFRGR